MSNEPIFQKLAAEYAMRGKSYERMATPYLSPVKPLGTKQPLMDTPVYAPDPHLDGPFKGVRAEEDNTITFETEVAVPTGSEVAETMMLRSLKPKSDLLDKGLAERQLALYRGMVVTVGGTLISEEDDASNPTTTKQTDESVNAASNEENDEDDEPVILAPNFWKIRDEE